MSRAFTKEDDAGDEQHERPIPEGPNYVTPRGLDLLRAEVRELLARREKAVDKKAIDRDLRYLEARIDSAIVVPPGSGAEARFGAAVTLKDAAGKHQTFRIVGQDEARTDPANLLPWSSPLAQALLGKKAGDDISWQAERGEGRHSIVKVNFGDGP